MIFNFYKKNFLASKLDASEMINYADAIKNLNFFRDAVVVKKKWILVLL